MQTAPENRIYGYGRISGKNSPEKPENADRGEVEKQKAIR